MQEPQASGRAPRADPTRRRSQELAKAAKGFGEEGKVAIRNIRRDAVDKIKKLEKRGLSEDTSGSEQEEVQKSLKKAEGDVETAVAAREKEITTI